MQGNSLIETPFSHILLLKLKIKIEIIYWQTTLTKTEYFNLFSDAVTKSKKREEN